MLKFPIWIALIAAGALQTCAQDVPKAAISNGQIRAVLYLPDARTGFYRSTRFDWSGVIASLIYRGHEYYGPWFHKVDSTVRDFQYDDSGVVASPVSATVGPAEEYQTDGKALGYDEAKRGGTFIKIGVGVLRKPLNETKYDHYEQYEIADAGKWTLNKNPGAVEFIQELSDPVSHYGYKYTKIVRLAEDKPQLVIEHVLKNTGSRAIRSSVYNHNFLVFGNQPPGPNLVTSTVYEIKSERPPDKEIGAISGKELVFLKTLENEERLVTSLTGFGSSPSDFDFHVEQRGAGSGVRIAGDHALEDVSIWSIRTVFALEPFVALNIEPGTETKWTLTYDYYTLSGSAKQEPAGK